MSTVGYPETLQAERSTAALWVRAVGKRPGREAVSHKTTDLSEILFYTYVHELLLSSILGTVKILVIGVLADLGLVMIVLNLFTPYLFDRQSDVIRLAQSPSGMHTAPISASTCKDADTSGTSISMKRTNESNQHAAQIFDNSSTNFELTWQSDNVLSDSYPCEISLHATPSEIGGIQILFESR